MAKKDNQNFDDLKKDALHIEDNELDLVNECKTDSKPVKKPNKTGLCAAAKENAATRKSQDAMKKLKDCGF